MKYNTWFYFKIVVVGFGILFGVFSSLFGSYDLQHIDIEDCVIVFFFCPIGLLFIIGIQVVNPFSGKVWSKPSWESFPFNLKDPLHFFHMGAFYILASTIGALISLLFQQKKIGLPILFYFCAGVGVLVGVKLCQFVYRRKYPIG